MFPGLGAVIGATVVMFVVLGAAAVLVPVALAYVALRVQDARRSTPDPKIGMKLAFHAVHTTAVLIALTGCSVFMIDVMEGTIAPANRPNFGGPPGGMKDDGLSSAKRTALALVASGTLFGLMFWAFLLGTNDAEQRSVRRVFVGARMALSLLITMFTVTGLIVTLAQKQPEHEVTESLLGMLLVWFAAGVVHMLLFFNIVNRKPKRSKDDDEDERPWRPER